MSLRLFGTRDPGDPAVARLDPAAARHLRARRVSAGVSIVVVLGPGEEYDAVLLQSDGGGATCRIGAARDAPPADPSRGVWLCVGLADQGRLDLVVEKATELGAGAVAVFRASRSQFASVSDSRLDRWRRIALAACEQCGRTAPPAIETGWSLDDVTALVARATEAIVFVTPRESVAAAPPVATGARTRDPGRTGTPPTAPKGAAGPDRVLVVGPEGGLDSDEVRRLLEAGARPASLGPRVLRFETAAIAALARHAPEDEGERSGVRADPLE